jgi:UDP-GlcNAc:undecaprenyl-phosphate GlcNAc-1-phosphate transferase
LTDVQVGSRSWLDAKLPNWSAWLGGVRMKTPSALAILAGGAVLHVMGLLDDRRPLSPAIKLILQILVALVLTAGFGIRAGEFLGPVPSILLTSLWIVALTNAFNFMDNMDGLSAGVAAITSLVLAVCALRAGQVFVPCFMLLIAGAVLGFLVYNFPPASIFMGDGGSLVVGYFLGVTAVLVTYYNPSQQREPAGVLLPLVVFAIPLYDALSVIVRRIRAGKSIFRSDKGHFSHRLVKLGMSRTAAALTIYLATLATALPAVLLPHAAWWQASLIFGQCLCVVAIIAILETRNGNPSAS